MGDDILDEFDDGYYYDFPGRNEPTGGGRCEARVWGRRCKVLKVQNKIGGKRYCNFHYKIIASRGGQG